MTISLLQKNTKKQGDVGLGVAIGWFVLQGYTVSVPLTDSQDYDLVVDINGTLKRVQVKTTRFLENNKFRVNLSVKGGNRSWNGKPKKFNTSAVDLLFILTSDNVKYLIPTSSFDAVHKLTLSKKYFEYIVT